MKKFTNCKILSEEGFIDSDLWIEGDEIINSPIETEWDQAEEYNLNGDFIVPAFIDLQIYGGDGGLFGSIPTIENLKKTVNYSLRGGASFIFPTVATNTNHIVFQAIDTIKDYWKAGGKKVGGLHLEGPFLNPIKRGAHPEDLIQKPTIEKLREILEYGRGVIKMITIAPEFFSDEMISLLVKEEIVISAGHTNLGYDEAKCFFEKGIKAATHLFNAMPIMHHRNPGIAGAILGTQKVYASIVADGIHVSWPMINIASKQIDAKLFLITDAVTDAIEGVYQHKLNNDHYIMPDGTLSGSALTMWKAVENCLKNLEMPRHKIFQMASKVPAMLIGKYPKRGSLQIGAKAEFIRITMENKWNGIYCCGEWVGEPD